MRSVCGWDFRFSNQSFWCGEKSTTMMETTVEEWIHIHLEENNSAKNSKRYERAWAQMWCKGVFQQNLMSKLPPHSLKKIKVTSNLKEDGVAVFLLPFILTYKGESREKKYILFISRMGDNLPRMANMEHNNGKDLEMVRLSRGMSK